ncbi:4a-hydroxytetrahydrobiopterin dehydratase [Cytobacillus oceanisediminis]|uniref:4a-hydroxytetrahydrobiopterin dehydratase n=1 Tax=Cytobacillus TaxID=2675230 RepID=UPI00203F422E|nr:MULTISPECIES: 4a-hydroxytetrahydrobiopterin dehydratase [Cytobacillus]MBY0158009.1 4a-hydroxytetrahydrobiopterin dehydratase [Cytobacillus firmus]MCM3395318.1 4a-hydroxytetrahydrobiopterin dehydratase [Cytobacillus oceanisediminis]MCM3529503.1 4a-hydroxytetrahydrobiopterin dehydratase [Cytobacillus oceanisediminis]UQX53030.1 4a-hydroxytetrahydrobiopterin dehydratase [Cytobacillus pseudoceanisediminis]
MKRLSEEEIARQLSTLSDWKRKDSKWIERRYRFKEYLDGIAFVNKIASLAEKENHHPFITIQYKMVIISLTSWSENGLTGLDFKLARKIDDLYLADHH